MTDEQPAKPRSKRLPVLCVAAGVACLLLVGLYLASPRRRLGPHAGPCEYHLEQIGRALIMYADDNGGVFPPGLRAVIPDYLDNACLLPCPEATRPLHRDRLFDPRAPIQDCTHYTCEPGLHSGMPTSTILGFDDSPDNHSPKGRNVLFIDASVEWWPASREAEFQERLRKQREAVRKWREAGAKKEDIDKFFGKLAEEKPE